MDNVLTSVTKHCVGVGKRAAARTVNLKCPLDSEGFNVAWREKLLQLGSLLTYLERLAASERKGQVRWESRWSCCSTPSWLTG